MRLVNIPISQRITVKDSINVIITVPHLILCIGSRIPSVCRWLIIIQTTIVVTFREVITFAILFYFIKFIKPLVPKRFKRGCNLELRKQYAYFFYYRIEEHTNCSANILHHDQ